MTRSEAERRFMELIEQAGLPRPRANVRVGNYEVDFLWPDAQLVVEVDGFAFHGSRTAFERDRRKQAELVARGLRVSRVTWRQIADEPLAVVAGVASALAGVLAAAGCQCAMPGAPIRPSFLTSMWISSPGSALVAVRWLGRLEPAELASPIRSSTAETVDSAIAEHNAISAPVMRSRRSAAITSTRRRACDAEPSVVPSCGR